MPPTHGTRAGSPCWQPTGTGPRPPPALHPRGTPCLAAQRGNRMTPLSNPSARTQAMPNSCHAQGQEPRSTPHTAWRQAGEGGAPRRSSRASGSGASASASAPPCVAHVTWPERHTGARAARDARRVLAWRAASARGRGHGRDKRCTRAALWRVPACRSRSRLGTLPLVFGPRRGSRPFHFAPAQPKDRRRRWAGEAVPYWATAPRGRLATPRRAAARARPTEKRRGMAGVGLGSAM